MNTEEEHPIEGITQKLEYYRLRANRKARAHYLTAKRHERSNIALGVPGIIANTIVGTAIFATISQQPATSLQVMAGLLSVSAGVLAALQTFFKHSERAEKHRLAASNYSAIFRKLDLLSLRKNLKADPKLEKNLLSELELIIEQLNQLEKDSPDIPDKIYDLAVREQKNDKDG